MNDKRRFKRAAHVRVLLNIKRTTFYRMIEGGRLLSKPGVTKRTTEICTGYYLNGELVHCLKNTRPIDCRSCTIAD